VILFEVEDDLRPSAPSINSTSADSILTSLFVTVREMPSGPISVLSTRSTYVVTIAASVSLPLSR
jgi:hypothetical protein